MGAPEIVRAARLVAEAYANAGEQTCPREFLAALTEPLDDLCGALGVAIPQFDHLAAAS